MATLRRISPKPIPRPSSPELTQLTASVRELVRQAARTDVEARVQIGHQLIRVRNLLKHGQWLDWVDREVPFTSRSAENYIKLSHFAHGDPARFGKIADLGATKVYLLMSLPPALFDRVLAAKDHLVPSANARKTLAVMTFAELIEVVTTLRGHRDAGAKLVRDYRRQVRALLRTIDQLVEHSDQISAGDVGDIDDVYDDLLDSVHRLGTIFALEA
jgi:hypothetical protein